MTGLTIKGAPVSMIKDPSDAQIRNAESMGWEYLGNGDFIKEATDDILTGRYTNEGFKIE